MIIDTDEHIDEFLEHYGVKGQKWGVRKERANKAAKATGRAAKATGRATGRAAKATGRAAKATGRAAKAHPTAAKIAVASIAVGAAYVTASMGSSKPKPRIYANSAPSSFGYYGKYTASGKDFVTTGNNLAAINITLAELARR